ncbi:MAG TPA: tetratricopeptide repeat protein [Allocoleopsis sp.]
MVPQPDDPHCYNEEIYDQLISLIENSQGRLAPIIVSCDDSTLRQRIIMRYESEARQVQIRPYRIVLGQEPSMRAGLEALKQQEEHLQDGGKAVFTVTGAELLLRVKLNPQDEQTELDKFFGYLQWTREGLREFRYPIVLWVTQRILREMSHRAPDFWSWRKAVLRFIDESPYAAQLLIAVNQSQSTRDNSTTEFLPPLAELKAEIAQLTARDPDTRGLATLYDQLGQVYAQRIEQGVAENLEQERGQAIIAFQQAVSQYQTQNNRSAERRSLSRLGSFFESQSLYLEAINCYQKSLQIAQEIGDRYGEILTLNGLGNAYRLLGQYQRAIDYYQQALEIEHQIGDRHGEGVILNNLGNAYHNLGQYQHAINHHQQAIEIRRNISDRNGEGGSLCNIGNTYRLLGQHLRAIELYQQALEIQREVGNRNFEANSLIGLGNAYHSLGQYQRAIDCHQEALKIKRQIGDRQGEATTLFNIAMVLDKIGERHEACQHYHQAKQIYQLLGLKYWMQRCDTAIYRLNQIITVQLPTRTSRIDDDLWCE